MTNNNNTKSTLLLSGKPKPWLSTEPKPWHAPSTHPQPPIEFTILESKHPASAASPKGKGEEDPFVIFSCGESDQLVVPEKVARVSGLVNSLLDSSGDYIEKQTRTIKFDHISASVLAEVVRFCTQECQENPSFHQSTHNSPPKQEQNDEKVQRTTFVFELKPELVMELMSAAEYLEIPSLVSHVISMLAAYGDDVPSFVGMSEHLVEQVINKCKPAVLRRIEMDGKLESFASDYATSVWKRMCGTLEDFVVTVQRDCRAKELAHYKYIHNNNNVPSNLVNSEVDWRRGYAELTLEKIMSKVAPDAQIAADLQAFAPVFGELVLYLRLYHGNLDPQLLSMSCPNIKFLEIVGHVGLHQQQVSSLITQLRNLQYLRISNNGADDKFWGNFFGCLEDSNIRELDVSSDDISRNGAGSVAALLRKNKNLKVLNISNNPIQLDGFLDVVTAGHSLQVLDASDCGIATGPKSEEILFPLAPLSHHLKVLKLNGNNFVKLSNSLWNFLFTLGKFLERVELARVLWVQRDKEVRTLISHLAELPFIEYLDLGDNHIDDIAIEALSFNLLLSRVPLKTLILLGNTVKDRAAASLARALRFNPFLEVLVLPAISDYALVELDAAITENQTSKIRNIVTSTREAPKAALKNQALFTIMKPSDPVFTYQMRWNPQPR